MRCPRCGAARAVVPVAFGFPSKALMASMEQRRMILGGDHLLDNCQVGCRHRLLSPSAARHTCKRLHAFGWRRTCRVGCAGAGQPDPLCHAWHAPQVWTCTACQACWRWWPYEQPQRWLSEGDVRPGQHIGRLPTPGGASAAAAAAASGRPAYTYEL
jgi:hypothetical protein